MKRLKKLIESKTLFTGSYSDADQHHDINLIRYDEDGLHYRYGIFDHSNPSYLIWEEPNLYTLSELDDQVSLSTYSYFKSPVSIFKSSEASIQGSQACHMFTQVDIPYIFIACYGSGHIHVYDKKNQKFINSFSPSKKESDRDSRAHSSIVTHSGQWLLVTDLGRDLIRVFDMDKIDGQTLMEHSIYNLPVGSGPRQIILSKDDQFIYCMNELNNTIMIFAFDKTTGNITNLIDTVSASDQENNAVGSSVMTQDYSLLIVPNRGPNTLSVFKVKDGKLQKLDEVDCMGDWPRYIKLSQSEKELFVANQKDGALAVFNLQRTGKVLLKYIDSIPIPLISCIDEIIEE